MNAWLERVDGSPDRKMPATVVKIAGKLSEILDVITDTDLLQNEQIDASVCAPTYCQKSIGLREPGIHAFANHE